MNILIFVFLNSIEGYHRS